MKVSELIEELKMLPRDSIVLIDGYEGGYCEVSTTKEIRVKLNVHAEDFYGPHDQTSDANTSAVLIIREPNHLAE